MIEGGGGGRIGGEQEGIGKRRWGLERGGGFEWYWSEIL